MSYPSPGPAGSPQPAAGSAYSPGGPYPQPNVLGSHPVPGQRRNQGILIGIVIAIVFAIAGLVIFGIVAKSTGAGGFTWGLVFAFVPIVPVIALYLWLDRYEPEPTKYILFALFIMGGLAVWAGSEAVLPAYIIGMVLAGTVGSDHILVRRLRTVTFGLLTPFYFIRAGSFRSSSPGL